VALADRSQLEFLLQASQVRLAEQTQALVMMEDTAVENSQLKELLAKSKAETSQLRVRVLDLTMSTGTLQEELSHMAVQLDSETNSTAALREQLSHMKFQLESEKISVASLQDKLAHISVQLDSETRQHEAGRQARSEASWQHDEKVHRLEAELHEYHALELQLRAELEKKVSTSEEDRARFEEEIALKNKEIEDANARAHETSLRLQEQSAHRAALMAAKEGEVENALAQLKDRDVLDGERCRQLVRLVQRLDSSVGKLEAEADDVSSNRSAVQAETQSRKHEIGQLQAIIAAKEVGIGNVRLLLQNEVGGILRELVSVQHEASLAMHVADSERLGLRKELDHLQEAYDVANVSKARKQSILEELQRQVDSNSGADVQVQQELAECREHLKRFRLQEAESSSELVKVKDECLSQLADLGAEIDEARAQNGALSAAVEQMQSNLELCEAKLAKAHDQVAEVRAEKAALIDEMAQEIANVKAQHVETAKYQEVLDVCKFQLEQMQEELASARLEKEEADNLAVLYKREVRASQVRI